MTGYQTWKRTQSYSQGPHFAGQTSEAQKDLEVMGPRSHNRNNLALGHERLFLLHHSFLKGDTPVPGRIRAQNPQCRDLIHQLCGSFLQLLEICFCSQIVIHVFTHSTSIYSVSSKYLKGLRYSSYQKKKKNVLEGQWISLRSDPGFTINDQYDLEHIALLQ